MLWLTAVGLRTAMLPLALVGTLLGAACATDSTAPTPSLVGTWDLIGFTDMGTAAVTTGTWEFRADRTFSVNGTITFPDEPTEAFVATGTYSQSGDTVVLTIGAETGSWILTASGSEVTLTEREPPPANTVTLRSHP